MPMNDEMRTRDRLLTAAAIALGISGAGLSISPLGLSLSRANATIPPGSNPQLPEKFRLLGISIISPPPNMPAANGPSDNTAFSQDNRDVRLVGFDSAATNLVPGDTNGLRDVFVLYKIRRAGSLGGRVVRGCMGADGIQF
jgi:hypothetical protein